MNAQLLDDIHGFWFGDIGDAAVLPEERLRYWMAGGEETDREIRERFGDCISRAAAVRWPVTSLNRQQAVGLVVLFDQFPRNCHRSSGEAFAYDHLARDLVRTLEASDWSFTLAERFFLGLPYVHHEDMASQDRAVFLAARELDRAPAGHEQSFRFNLDQAIRHRAIIQQFGRFPTGTPFLDGRPRRKNSRSLPPPSTGAASEARPSRARAKSSNCG